MSAPGLEGPVPLTAIPETSGFVCRHESLSEWLRKRALANAVSGASRTYAVCEGGNRVVGYYALAAGAIALVAAPGRLLRNMPDPLPVVVLGWLAVHLDWEGKGVLRGLLKDAVLRSLQAADLIGVRALLCHAIDDAAMSFYLALGFVESPLSPRTVLLGLGR